MRNSVDQIGRLSSLNAMGRERVQLICCFLQKREGAKFGSGTLGILPFMAKWTIGILDGGRWGVGGVTTVCGRDYIYIAVVACYVQQCIT